MRKKINGIDYRIVATKKILKLGNYSKVIFTSKDSSIREEALAAGAVSFKIKPFTIENLKRNIEKTYNQNKE
jgi:response regulator of citrate/malate metabolism